MEQSEIDSKADTPDEVPLESKQDSILGKFASTDELAKAYEQLQSAFTRKSQELAELKVKDKASVAIETNVENISQVAVPADTTREGGEGSLPAVISGGAGGLAFTNVSEATTIHATTKVVENYFKEKGNKI